MASNSISCERFAQIQGAVEPYAEERELNFYDFLRGASDDELVIVASKHEGVSADELIACRNKAIGWVSLGLIDQDLSYAGKYRPDEVEFWQVRANQIRNDIE